MSSVNFDKLVETNNIEVTSEEVSDLIDDYNVERYRNDAERNSSADVLICKCCKRDTSVDDSYSDQGLFVHCIACVDQNASQSGKSTTQWLKENVWMREM